jgi:hypothetical protein
MKFVKLNRDDTIPSSTLVALGKYTFIQKLRLKGTGSPRLVYHGGSSNFDEIAAIDDNLNYAQIELFPHGMAVRMRKRSNGQAAAILFKDLTLFDFKTWKLEVHLPTSIQIVNVGELTISTDDHTLVFSVNGSVFSSIREFLLKKEFSGIARLIQIDEVQKPEAGDFSYANLANYLKNVLRQD